MQRAVREDRHRLAFEMTEPRERLRRRALVAQAAVDVEGLPLASQHLGIECRLAVEGLRVRSLERRLENFNAPESGAVDGSFYRHPGLVQVFASRGGAARTARLAFVDGCAVAEPPAQAMPRPEIGRAHV